MSTGPARRLLCTAFLGSLLGAARALAGGEPVASDVSGLAVGAPERFARYEDSYAIWNRMQNNGWSGGHDDQALRGHYSFKYTFCGQQLHRSTAGSPSGPGTGGESTLCPTRPALRNIELFFGFTGEFDFYYGTRASSPVINRLSQPGFYARFPMAPLVDGSALQDSVEVGIQHRSNGQVTDVSLPGGDRRAGENYAAGNREYFDTISRSAQFASIAVDRGVSWFGQPVELRSRLKLYFGSRESEVNWGPLANRGLRFADYDRLTLRATTSFKPWTFDAEWRLGDKGLATDSWNFGFQWDLAGVPLYARVHRGPMNTLSNYTQRQDSIGIGLRFARY